MRRLHVGGYELLNRYGSDLFSQFLPEPLPDDASFIGYADERVGVLALAELDRAVSGQLSEHLRALSAN